MGHRATRRKARQGLVSLKKSSGNVKSGTFLFPEEARPTGPEKSIRYSTNTSEVKSLCSIGDAKRASTVANPKVHIGRVWKTGYRSKTTEMALCPTRSSPLSTGRWAITRPLPKPSTRMPMHRFPPKIVRQYGTYAQACFWRDRLNRLLRRKHNLWYTIVDRGLT